MRVRPYVSASERPRPYSLVRAERGEVDLRQRTIEQIAELEAESKAEARDPCGDAQRALQLQLQAEELRVALYHTPR